MIDRPQWVGDLEDRNWTEDDIALMICNPIYAGIVPFPQIISDETWIAAASKFIGSEGRTKFLRTMLRALRTSFKWADTALHDKPLDSEDRTGTEE